MKPQNRNFNTAPIPEPEDDDIPMGRVWSRKEVITLFGGAAGMLLLSGCGGGSSTSGSSTSGTGLTALAASATPTPTPSASASTSATPTPPASASATPAASATPTPTPTTSLSCVATPQLTEGPYWVDEMLNRSDIRTDAVSGVAKAGTPLVLNLAVANVNGACAPLSGATVDIWHCDASGVYSDEAAGWYAGRAVHIHFRVRATINGKSYNFTSQLFFDENLTDTVFTQAPYSSRGSRTTRNSNDNIYQSQMQMVLAPSGSGYAATFVVGLSV